MDESLDGKNAVDGMQKVVDKDTDHDGDDGDDNIIEDSLSLCHPSNLHSSKTPLLLHH